MTSDEELGADRARGHPGEPVLREIIPAVGRGGNRRRLDLQKLLSAVLPDPEVAGNKQLDALGTAVPLLNHDLELLRALEAEGFDGLIWSELSDRLARYGLGVIGALIYSGEIYKRTTDLDRPVNPARPPFSSDEAIAVAIDTVADGIKLFRKKGLEQHDWDPARGARLSTYFVNGCVLCFANPCRRQLTQRSRADLDVFVPDFEWSASAAVEPSAERVAMGRLRLVDTMLPGRKARPGEYPADVVDLVVSYSLFGYKSNEIAELISSEAATYSPSMVRKILSAYRKEAAKETREGGRA